MVFGSAEDSYLGKVLHLFTSPFKKFFTKTASSLSNLRPPGLRRELGLFDLILIGVGSTIEGSIFVLLAPGAAIAGVYLPFSFLLGAILALAVAFIYSEVAANMPKEGADLRFIFASFSADLWAFVTSWLVILGDLAYFVLNLLGLSIYVGAFLPINQLTFAVVVLIAMAILNLRGVKRVNALERIVTILLLFFLAIFVGWIFFNQFGTWSFSGLGMAEFDTNVIFSIVAGTALIYSAFIGYEDVTSVAGEVKNPHQVIPKALIATVFITSSIYLLLSFLAVHTIPLSELQNSKTPVLLLAKVNNIPTLLVTISALFAILSTLIVSLLVASRKLFALSQEGYLKGWFGRLNSRGAPTFAVLFCSLVSLLLLITSSVKFVAYLGNSVYLVGIIATTAALIIMRRRDKNFGRWFRTPFFPFLPILVIAFSAFVLFFVEREALLYVVGWALLGGLIYYSKKLLKA